MVHNAVALNIYVRPKGPPPTPPSVDVLHQCESRAAHSVFHVIRVSCDIRREAADDLDAMTDTCELHLVTSSLKLYSTGRSEG